MTAERNPEISPSARLFNSKQTEVAPLRRGVIKERVELLLDYFQSEY